MLGKLTCGPPMLKGVSKKAENWYNVLHHCTRCLWHPVHGTSGSGAGYGWTSSVLETYG
jgi:hypothetical protein